MESASTYSFRLRGYYLYFLKLGWYANFESITEYIIIKSIIIKSIIILLSQIS